jgi:hypothetical protein
MAEGEARAPRGSAGGVSINIKAPRRGRALRVPAKPADDAYLACPGSTLVHAPAYLTIMQGPKARFVKCPLPQCKLMLFMAGEGWKKVRGLTKKEIYELNPNALIL